MGAGSGLLGMMAQGYATKQFKDQRKLEEEMERIRTLQIMEANEQDPTKKSAIQHDLSEAYAKYASPDDKQYRGLASKIIHTLGSGALDVLGMPGPDPRLNRIPLQTGIGAGGTGGASNMPTAAMPGLMATLAGIQQPGVQGLGLPTESAGRTPALAGRLAYPERTPIQQGIGPRGLLSTLAYGPGPGGTTPEPVEGANLQPQFPRTAGVESGLGYDPAQEAAAQAQQEEATRALPLSTFGRAGIRTTPQTMRGTEVEGMEPLPAEDVGRALYQQRSQGAFGRDIAERFAVIDANTGPGKLYETPEEASRAKQTILEGQPRAATKGSIEQQTIDLALKDREQQLGRKLSYGEQLEVYQRIAGPSAKMPGEVAEIQAMDAILDAPEGTYPASLVASIRQLKEKKLADPQAKINAQEADAEAKAIAEGIKAGRIPPQLTGLGRAGIQAKVISLLAADGYDLKAAQLDWDSLRRYRATINGPQQTRFRQAMAFALPTLDQVDDAIDQLKAVLPDTQFPIFNRAAMIAAEQGLVQGPTRQQAQIAAQRLDNLIRDSTLELANMYMGGNSPTDQAFRQASELFNSAWTAPVLKSMLQQTKGQVLLRVNSLQVGPAGLTDGPIIGGVPSKAQVKLSSPDGKDTRVVPIDDMQKWLDKGARVVGLQ